MWIIIGLLWKCLRVVSSQRKWTVCFLLLFLLPCNKFCNEYINWHLLMRFGAEAYLLSVSLPLAYCFILGHSLLVSFIKCHQLLSLTLYPHLYHHCKLLVHLGKEIPSISNQLFAFFIIFTLCFLASDIGLLLTCMMKSLYL